MNEDIQNTLKKIEQYTLLQAKEVLDIDDLCLLYNWKKQTVYNMISKKEIPHYKSRGVRFKKSEINDWLLQNKQKTLAEITSQALLTTL